MCVWTSTTSSNSVEFFVATSYVQKYEFAVFRWSYCRYFIENVTRTLIFLHDTDDVLCMTVWTKDNFGIVQKYEYDLK